MVANGLAPLINRSCRSCLWTHFPSDTRRYQIIILGVTSKLCSDIFKDSNTFGLGFIRSPDFPRLEKALVLFNLSLSGLSSLRCTSGIFIWRPFPPVTWKLHAFDAFYVLFNGWILWYRLLPTSGLVCLVYFSSFVDIQKVCALAGHDNPKLLKRALQERWQWGESFHMQKINDSSGFY